MTDLSWPAARYLDPSGGRGAVRGHLELTATHLSFRPAGVAAKVPGTPFSVRLKHLAGAGINDGASGLLRRRRERLCVTLGDGSEQLFDISRPDEVAEIIRERLAARS